MAGLAIRFEKQLGIVERLASRLAIRRAYAEGKDRNLAE
jgi:hypothetical protein